MRIFFLMRVSFVIAVSLLILHEMDAVYWREWQLFGISDDLFGRNLFILVHLPLYVFFFYLYCSLRKVWAIRGAQVLSLFLILHFFLHLNAYYTDTVFSGVLSFGIISVMVPASLVFLIASVLYRHWNKVR